MFIWNTRFLSVHYLLFVINPLFLDIILWLVIWSWWNTDYLAVSKSYVPCFKFISSEFHTLIFVLRFNLLFSLLFGQSYNWYLDIQNHIESIFFHYLFSDLMNKYVVNYLCIWYVYKSSFISYWIQFYSTTFLRNNRAILFYFDSCKQIEDFIKNIILYQKISVKNIAR